MRSMDGVWSDWDVKIEWEGWIRNEILPACTEPVGIVPAFEDNFKGWIQANNFIIRYFSPDVPFGWQENIWSGGSSSWIHENYYSDEIETLIVGPTVQLRTDFEVFGGEYSPDFIVFDKYEMDAISGHWLFNARD